MLLRKKGAGAGGGGGLTLGPPTNTFNGADRATAEAARDTYAGANVAWLAEYDAEPTYTIIITWPVIPTNTVYQSRRSSAWADVTGLVRGPMGIAGRQARFLVYAYINAAAAPAAAPASTTFVRSTGALTVPATYAAIPATPAAGSKTYRTEAIVNPATDADIVNLVWSLPAELPAYLAAGLAQAAQAAAEVAQAAAEAAARTAVDIPTGSPRGALIGTSPTLSVTSVTNATVRAFGAAEVWTLGANAPAEFTLALIANNERFLFPDLHSPGLNGVWYVVEVDGTEIDEVFMPWGGVSQSPANANSVQYLSAAASGVARNLTIRYFARSGDTPAYAAIYGAGTVLPANTVLKVYAAVVRGEKGDPGTGGGMAVGGTTEARVQELINATSLSALQGLVTDGQIPDAIMRDSEFTSATIVALITGNIAFSDIDGMIADGQVPAAIMRDAELTLAAVGTALGLSTADVAALLVGEPTISGSDLTFVRNDGTSVTITLPAGMGGGTADGRLRFGMGEPGSALGNDNDAYLDVSDGGFYEKSASAWTLQFTAEGLAPTTAHTRYFGIKQSASRVIATADFADANTSETDEGAFPANTANGYPWFAVPEDQGQPTEFYRPPNPVNQIVNYDRQVGTSNDDNGDAHIVMVGQTQLPISITERNARIGYS